MADEAEGDLEAQGLIGECYDSVFSIRQRLRKINDIPIPVKQGVTLPQIGVFFSGIIATFLVFVLILRPLSALLGFSWHWLLVVGFIFGLPVMAAQRVIKPMRYGKSITSTLTSKWRDLTDDPVHARGKPIKARPEEGVDGPTLVYWRRWVPADEVAEPEETDARAEALLAGFVDDTEQWATDKALDNQHEHQRKMHDTREQTVFASSTRSRGNTVIMDDEQE